MKGFEVKEFAAPEGVEVDKESQQMFGAIRTWLQDTFADFADSMKSGAEYVNEAVEALKTQGFSPDKIAELEKTLKTQGTVLEKMREGVSQPVAPKNDALKEFVKSHHAEMVKAFQEHRPFALDMPTNKAAAVITTSTAVTSTTDAVYRGYYETDPTFYYKRSGRQYIRDIADVRRVRRVPTTLEYWEEGAENGAFAVVAENGLKPLVDVSLVLNQAKKQKAAGMMTVTQEVLMDADELAENLVTLFVDKLWRDYENGLTTSLLTNAVAYTSTSLDGTIAEPNDFDAISAAALQVASLDFNPTDLVLNTADAYAMSLVKDSTGRYILPIVTDGGSLTIRSLRVTVTTKLAQGEFLVGERDTWKVREGEAILRSGLSDDDFKYNRISFVGEVFYNSYVPSNYAGSWVKGNFATIKEALKVATTPGA